MALSSSALRNRLKRADTKTIIVKIFTRYHNFKNETMIATNNWLIKINLVRGGHSVRASWAFDKFHSFITDSLEF